MALLRSCDRLSLAFHQNALYLALFCTNSLGKLVSSNIQIFAKCDIFIRHVIKKYFIKSW